MASASNSASNSNSSDILDQDTEEVQLTNYQEVGNYNYNYNHNYGYSRDSNYHCHYNAQPHDYAQSSTNIYYSDPFDTPWFFQADIPLDSSVESNPVDEEIYQRAKSEEKAEDGHPYYPPIQMLDLQELQEINHRQVLVNLINNAKIQAESDWGWRDDVEEIDRDEALTNLTLLYDNLLDKYDYLEAAYDVLAEIYNQSQLLADAQEDVEDVQDAHEDVHVREDARDALVPQDASAQEAEAGPTRIQIPGGYTKSECGRIVKIQEIAPPQINIQPRPQPPTLYPIPQHSTSFANVTNITNITQLSAVSKSPMDSAIDIFAEDGEGGESADDPDYNPGIMDSREADAENEDTSDDTSKSESGASSLRTYHAGVTSANLYSHPPETRHQAKVRVNTWMDSANEKATRLRSAQREAAVRADGSYSQPEAIHTPVTAAHMIATVGADPSLRPAGPIGPIRPNSPVTRRSKLRPTSRIRPLSYLLRGLTDANHTFREYVPEVVEVSTTDSDNP
jgi:hypothetical protein